MDTSEIIPRLKAFIANSGLSDRAFAISCGINQPTLFNQLKGLRSLSLETVQKICAKFPELSPEWILLGNGDMFKEQNKEVDRINSLVDTIALLQDAIKAKSDTIASLNDRIRQLENQLKSK